MKNFLYAGLIALSCAILGYGYFTRQSTVSQTIPVPHFAPEPEIIETSQQINTHSEDEIVRKRAVGFNTLSTELSNITLSTTGTIPTWLSGSLLRNGAAQFELNTTSFNRWFDGFAMIHRFAFDRGTVTYTNKFIESDYYRKANADGKLPRSFSEEKKSLWSRVSGLFAERPKYDNVNVNVCMIGGKHAAITETPHAVTFDPITLHTCGPIAYDDNLSGHVCTAHPQHDPDTGNMVNVLLEFGKTSAYHIFTIKPGSAKRELIGSVQTKEPSFLHSFALTKNYVILTLAPFVVNPFDLMLSSKPYLKNFAWKPQLGTKLVVVDRATGKQIATYTTKPFFSFHQINAHDSKQIITIDLVTYLDAEVINRTNLCTLRTSLSPTALNPVPERITINLKKNSVHKARITPLSLETPRIHPAYETKEYTWAYAPNVHDTHLYKLNVKNGHHLSWHQPHSFVGEPIFVPNPDGKAEDDGVVLSVVLDAERNKSYLLILDGKSFKELGRAWVPHHIPLGFHGQYYNK